MGEGDTLANQFADQWQTRDAALTAVSDYADSLAGIVAASNAARRNFEAVAENVKSLAVAAGIALPVSGAVGLVSDSVQFIYEQYARARAANSLEQALDAAQPAIEQIAARIAKDLRLSSQILTLANTELRQSLQTDVKNQQRLGFRENLLAQRDAIYAQSRGDPESRDAARLKELDALITTTDAWHGPLEEQLRAVRLRELNGQDLFAAAAAGVEEWAMAHRALVAAIKDRRPYTARSLVEATSELRLIIERIREL